MENLPDPSSLPPALQVWGSVVGFLAMIAFAILKYMRPPPLRMQQQANDMLVSGLSIADARPWRSMATSLERIEGHIATLVELQQTIAYEADIKRRLKLELAAERDRNGEPTRGPRPRARPRLAYERDEPTEL